MPLITGKFILEQKPNQLSSGNTYFSLLMSSGAHQDTSMDSDYLAFGHLNLNEMVPTSGSHIWKPEVRWCEKPLSLLTIP